ncbi:NAD(P)H-dependent oxidoreductase [Methylotuvimicrobium sp. KM2]|uniref:NAD(P)H-dependent oxidoreductase n=1 Tax=Methylotuvimicrobium sp. KM2 TaxID=3133976 RepID=UPI003100F044
MTAKRIAIIQGHPDPDEQRFCRALANAYADGADSAGHQIKMIDIARIEFPILRTQHEFEQGAISESIRQTQDIIQWADHLVIIYPLWLGSMPAYLKAFLEQVFRPGFAAVKSAKGKPWKKCLSGRSARIVVTMGMPAFVYRFIYLAHSLKSLERNILGFCGIGPTKDTLIGMVEAIGDDKRRKWLRRLEKLGQEGR